MSQSQAVNITFASRVETPHKGNANEILEPKTLPNGHPYISGQSVRRALENAIFQQYPSLRRGCSEVPNKDIKADPYSDIFGFLIPSEGKNRCSPLKVTDLVSSRPIHSFTDNLVRFSDFGKKGKEGSSSVDIRMSNIDLHNQAIYTGSIFIDLRNIGREVSFVIPNDKEFREKLKKGKLLAEDFANFEYREDVSVDVGEEVRNERTKMVIDAVLSLDSGFANQARHAFSMYPDIILASVQPIYNHQLAKALFIDEDDNIDIPRFIQSIKEVLAMKSKVACFVGFGINNREELIEALMTKVSIPMLDTSFEVIEYVKENL